MVTTEQVLSLLPQTQCRQCGFDGCRSYAEAIVRQKAPINRCPAGGQGGIHKLADLLAVPALPLDPCCGSEQPRVGAVINEPDCVGCTRCIQACPVDAIIGASRMTHTVVTEYCTGCKLCLPVCPANCIELKNISGTRTGWEAWTPEQARQARERAELRQSRLQTESNGTGRFAFAADEEQAAARPDTPALQGKKSAILCKVLERARTRLKTGGSPR